MIHALQYAATAGNWDIVRLLVEAGADVNAPAYRSDPVTALEAATFQGHVEMVAFLLDRGANVNASGTCDHRFPKTVLTTAVKKNHLGLVELLLNAGADVNMPSYDDYGCTALESAKSRPASSEIVNVLIAKGARDTAPSPSLFRKIQLFRAARKGDFGRVQFLVNLGVQIDMQTIHRHLLDNSDDESESTTTILDWALYNNWDAINVELFRFLVNKVEHVKAQEKASALTRLLVRAVERQNIELVEISIDAGADVNGVTESSGREDTPLICAAGQRNSEIVRFLLRKRANINATVKGWRCTTALQASLNYGHVDIFYLLLANGARINAPIASHGSSELAYAAQTSSIQVVRELLDRGAEINPNLSDEGEPALQAAAGLYTANMAMVQLLLERGADVNAPGPVTALQAAVSSGHFQLALLLLEAGADINAQGLKGPYFKPKIRTALETAAFDGHLDILHLLLNAGADMHLPITKRYVRATALARWRGHIVIADTLERWEGEEGEVWEEAEGWEGAEGWDDWEGWEEWEEEVEWEDGENWEKWKKWKKWAGWEKWEKWETWEEWKTWNQRENLQNNREDYPRNSKGKERVVELD